MSSDSRGKYPELERIMKDHEATLEIDWWAEQNVFIAELNGACLIAEEMADSISAVLRIMENTLKEVGENIGTDDPDGLVTGGLQ